MKVRVIDSKICHGNQIRLRDELPDRRDLIIGLLDDAIVELVTQVNQTGGFMGLASSSHRSWRD